MTCYCSLKDMIFLIYIVDGSFGPWSAWSACTATCGGGAMSRFRNCSNPTPKHGGKGCERIGAAFEIKSCAENVCPGMTKPVASFSSNFP